MKPAFDEYTPWWVVALTWVVTLILSVCTLAALILFVSCAPVHAAGGVFLDTEVARRLVGEVYAGRECLEQLSLCDSQRGNQAEIIAEMKKAEEGLLADQSAILAETNGMRDGFKECVGDLAKCEESKPSRLKWYAGGVVTGVLAVVLAGMALK